MWLFHLEKCCNCELPAMFWRIVWKKVQTTSLIFYTDIMLKWSYLGYAGLIKYFLKIKHTVSFYSINVVIRKFWLHSWLSLLDHIMFLANCADLNTEELVTQLCLTLCNPMDWSLPGPSVCGILQARILEWIAISFSRRSSQPRDWTWVSHISGRFLTIWASRRASKYWGPGVFLEQACQVEQPWAPELRTCIIECI